MTGGDPSFRQKPMHGGRHSRQGNRKSTKSECVDSSPVNQLNGYITRGSPELMFPQTKPSPIKGSQVNQYFTQNRKVSGQNINTRSPNQRYRKSSNNSPVNCGVQQAVSPSLVLNGRRNTPESPTASYFAGSKFGDAPSPAILPLPPSHWIRGNATGLITGGPMTRDDHCMGLTSGLKVLLQVQ